MEKITKYYTDEEIVEAVLNSDPEFIIVCKLLKDGAATGDDVLKIKNKEL